jgi:negative regulator of replication initiation
MQTTIDIPDELYRQVESKAAREGVPVGHIITRTLRLALGETPLAARQRIAFPLHHSTRPGTLSVEEVRAAEEAVAQEEDASRAGSL